MATITIACAAPAGSTVRVYDRHDWAYIGEAVSDGTGTLVVPTSYPALDDFMYLIASEEVNVNVPITPTSILIEP